MIRVDPEKVVPVCLVPSAHDARVVGVSTPMRNDERSLRVDLDSVAKPRGLAGVGLAELGSEREIGKNGFDI